MNAELKGLKRLWKSFPAKGSGQNVAELKKEIEKEISSIKETQKILKSENLVPFGFEPVKPSARFDDNLLGDLLFYLRNEKLMSTLMLCRQIEHIGVVDNIAFLESDSADIEQLFFNEKHKAILEIFFKGKGLGFKLKEKIKEVDPINSLREFFGEKLIVK